MGSRGWWGQGVGSGRVGVVEVKGVGGSGVKSRGGGG